MRDPKDLETDGKRLDVLHRSKEQRFFFDRIFRNTSQEVVYQRSCRNLVKPILEGYNATVFAYGTTVTSALDNTFDREVARLTPWWAHRRSRE